RAQPLDADADARLVHEREDLAPARTDLAEQLTLGGLEHQSAGRRAADGEFVLGTLDDIVGLLHDEQTQPVETDRVRNATRQHDDELPVTRGDELLAAGEPPAGR